MPEWLHDAFQKDVELSISLLVIRMAGALALGCVVAGIYRSTRRAMTADASSLVPTLVLLTVIISMVTLAIGNSVARAFSLVGALSIVRFRTVVEDTRDTAFVIFAVAVGLAVERRPADDPTGGHPVRRPGRLPLPRAPERLPVGQPPRLPRAEGPRRRRPFPRHAPVREVFGKHLERSRVMTIGTASAGAKPLT